MKELVIIDGYNYLFGIFDNLRLKNNELEEIREKLIEELAEYKNITGYDIIVVFDSYKVTKSTKSTKKCKGIELIFSGAKTTADHIIELLSNTRKEYDRKTIVTSDNIAQTVIFKENIYRKSSREFYLELQNIKAVLDKKIQSLNRQNRKTGFFSLEKRLGKNGLQSVTKYFVTGNEKKPKNLQTKR